DPDLVARDGHLCVDLELRTVEWLQHVDGLEAAVGQAGDRGADAALRIVVELVHRCLDLRPAAALAEPVEAPGGKAVCGALCTEVAAPLFGVAHPGDQGVEDVVVEPSRRDHYALLVEPARVRGEAARLA